MSETDEATETTTEQPRKLFGAAAAAAAKKAAAESGIAIPPTSDPLDALFANLEEAWQTAQDEVMQAREVLADKERRFRTVDAIKAVRDGSFQLTAPAPARPRAASTGTRAPRGEMARRILEELEKEKPDGLPRGDLLTRLGARGDKTMESAISNSLVAMKKRGTINHDSSGFYSIPEP